MIAKNKKNSAKPIVHSHQDAFFDGSLETGLGSLNGGEMGFDLMSLVNPLIAKVTGSSTTTPASTTSTATAAAPVTTNKTMEYVKIGAIAVGALALLAIVMKSIKNKSASKSA
jgi:hypothetical protein